MVNVHEDALVFAGAALCSLVLGLGGWGWGEHRASKRRFAPPPRPTAPFGVGGGPQPVFGRPGVSPAAANLPAPLVLTGLVTDGSRPIAGARARLVVGDSLDAAEARTDASGAYTLTVRPDLDPITVEVSHRGQAALVGVLGRRPPGATRAVLQDAVLSRHGGVRVRVVDRTGSPLQATVQVGPPRVGTRPASAREPKTHETDAGGELLLERLEQGRWGLEVSAPGFTPLSQTVEVRPAVTVDATLTLSAPRVVRGVVLDADGEPVAGALVATAQAVRQGPTTGDAATTGADGRFVLGAAAGLVDLHAWTIDPPRLASLSLDPARPSRAGPLELRLAPWTGVELLVRGPADDGPAAAGALVRVLSTGPRPRKLLEATTDAAGRAALVVAPGTYEVELWRGREQAGRWTITLGPGDAPRAVVERAGRVTGVVVDRAGRPRADVAVELHAQGRGGPVHATLTTDREGRFSSPLLPVGRVGLVARVGGDAAKPAARRAPRAGDAAPGDAGDLGGGSTVPAEVEVPDVGVAAATLALGPGEAKEERLALTPGGSITVRVTLPAGGSPAGLGLRVVRLEPPFLSVTQACDDAGRAVFEALPPGKVRVELDPGARSTGTSARTRWLATATDVLVEEGGAARVDLPLRAAPR